MKTVLQELIQWTIENAFNIEAQDGTNYIVIDHEEMRIKFDEWLEKEKKQVINAYDQDLYGGIYRGGTDCNDDLSSFKNNPKLITLEEWDECVNGVKQEEPQGYFTYQNWTL